MKREEFLAKILDVIQPEEDVTEETNLEDLEEWDSLAVVSVLTLCHRMLNFRPDARMLNHCTTMAEVLDLAEGHYK